MISIANILSNSNYKEQLKSPEWKAFSRSIRNQRGNACEICKRGKLQTDVHHWFYDSSRKLWEYAPDEVVLLCRGCHHELHEQLKAFRKHVFSKMNVQQFKILNAALKVGFENYEPLVFVHAIMEMVSSRSVEQFANGFGMSARRKTDEQASFEKFRRTITGNINGLCSHDWVCANCEYPWKATRRPQMWGDLPFCDSICVREWTETETLNQQLSKA